MSDRTTRGGIGFVGLLTIVFIVLKLTGVINWSWIWVLCPLWINFIVCIVVGIIFVCFIVPKQEEIRIKKFNERLEEIRKEYKKDEQD